MFKLKYRHSITLAENILADGFRLHSTQAKLGGIKESRIIYKNIFHKNFITLNLNFFKKIINSKRGELILHPELSKKTNSPSQNLEEKYQLNEEAKTFTENDCSQDEDLDFIKLDKNGVPIIKRNFYECLGVEQTAPPKDIKRNFLKIAKKFHPDKHPDSLAYFTHICSAYEILMDVHKRAAYDDDLLNNSEGVYYIKIWKFKINIFACTLFALSFFVSYYLYEIYKKLRMRYICPLGDSKFEVDQMKFSEQNLNLLNFIETTKEEIKKQNIKKIAEDDEYEYYVENS